MSSLLNRPSLANVLAGDPPGLSSFGSLAPFPPNRLDQPRRPMALFEIGTWERLKIGDKVPEWLVPFAAWAAIAADPWSSIAFDRFGRELHWSEYGQKSAYGWQVDHYPRAQCDGGGDVLGNLQALHWHINATLGGLLGAAR